MNTSLCESFASAAHERAARGALLIQVMLPVASSADVAVWEKPQFADAVLGASLSREASSARSA